MKHALEHLTDLTVDEAIHDGVVLVDFFAEWCGPCRLIAPVLEELSQVMAGKVKVFKLDVDAAPQTAARFGISSIPTMILFKKGREFRRIVGLKDIDALKNLCNEAF